MMMKDAKVFTNLDACFRFWLIPFTTVKPAITLTMPFGRYKSGIASAPEQFYRKMSQMLEDFESVICHADDVFVYGKNKQEHDMKLHCVLQKFQK